MLQAGAVGDDWIDLIAFDFLHHRFALCFQPVHGCGKPHCQQQRQTDEPGGAAGARDGFDAGLFGWLAEDVFGFDGFFTLDQTGIAHTPHRVPGLNGLKLFNQFFRRRKRADIVKAWDRTRFIDGHHRVKGTPVSQRGFQQAF